MLNFLKKHWFGLLATIIVVCYTTMIVVVAVSPHRDNLDRGFVPCTKEMMQAVLDCDQGGILCMSKAIVKNTWCDAGVMATGFKNWIKGDQARPWSNYMFEPELLLGDEGNSEVLEEFYKQNPNVKQEMSDLNKIREKLEKKLEEKTEDEELPQE